MEDIDLDEFEAMEAEAEAAAVNNPPRQGPPIPMKGVARPGQPNPNIARSPPPQRQRPQQVQQAAQPQEPAAPQPLWLAYYQPEATGIVNTQTGEKIEGFKDEGNAQAMARVLNDLNNIIISGGF
ncbi:hypothetical protein M0R04_08995 [Candidatus Dojkabacteria bacterium]|jgi:hypothetical protein|nr:hypothetical protein [Candidatus Dojkabacteria bacterium]